MKIFKMLSLILLISLILCACSSKSVKTDISASEIAEAFTPLLSNADNLSPVSADYVFGMLEIDTSLLSDFVLKIQTAGTEIDQYGVFKVIDPGTVPAVESAVGSYLGSLRSNFEAFNYLPEEKTKLDSAECRTLGSYVVFAILSPSEKEAVFNELDSLLK